ncbi:mechanosensitive ion channel [Thermosynechococcaceae cyanobacterium BACA0444]|uniref:Mechanosensitive ion channel n=1 Tax=Pseudocalidococcus azoricus BACA0444 TaxID=2918990 RepID=A0AAE4FSD9_9CYAN|nr:mechanosensitive ion channel domain-containing protein [Pseudocalidococcus azoricus]MDS3860076.1 mechanosensitive ion channel [Pseudocalidococcus azoricus BACA0444]
MSISDFLHIWDRAIFKLGNQTITIAWIISLALTLVLLGLGIIYCKKFLRNWLLVKLGISRGNSVVISTLLTYGLGAIIAVIILQVYGLDITSLAVVLGGLGVGIGFGLQDLTKNIVSGVTLLVENKLQVGDYVEFSGLTGYIKEISMRSTIITTLDGGDVILPNSTLTTNEVLNWSYRDFSGRIRLPITVAYRSDPVLVTETLLYAVHKHPAVRREPLPRVIFKGFGDSALEFEVWAWVDRIDNALTIKSSLNFTINYYFRQAGIEIPFPQQDIWFRNPETLRPPTPISPEFLASPLGELNHNNHDPGLDSSTCSETLPNYSLRECLHRIPYFQTCNELSVLQIIQSGYRKFLSRHSILFQAGEAADAMYVLLSGEIESFSHKLNRRIKVYQAGEMFGEVPVLLNFPYIVDARALTDCHIFVIPKVQLETLLKVAPYFAEIVTQEMISERELYDPVQQKLEELGLFKTMEQKDVLAWVRTRVKELLSLSSN